MFQLLLGINKNIKVNSVQFAENIMIWLRQFA